MIGYMRPISPNPGKWVLFNEYGNEVAHGDCVFVTSIAIRYGITVLTIH